MALTDLEKLKAARKQIADLRKKNADLESMLNAKQVVINDFLKQQKKRHKDFLLSQQAKGLC